MNNDMGHAYFSPWAKLWVTICHYLWTWRNKDIYDESFVRPFKHQEYIMAKWKEFLKAHDLVTTMDARKREQMNISWEPP